jgi:cobalt-zinc-cadmium resistance protein CzcA
MQISRDDTKRRIVIGINVRNRDVESFVEEVNTKLDASLELPPGYSISYGGSFENLRAAQRSSSIAVPIALALIFVLLYFSFHSLKQSIMVFTAIPLAAIGGIWALHLRDMPFSISAGVGFIALFGVAVLDGIVLISYYNQLQKDGIKDIYERVRIGTSERLRPVLMTSFVAALGFLPMAISTAAGAEVQRPLATVVIGGIISSTFLTLVVLPVLYLIFNDGLNLKPMKKAAAKIGLFLAVLTLPAIAGAQENPEELSLNQAVEMALQNNDEIRNARMNVEIAESLKKSSFNLPAPEFNYEWGQINSNLSDRYIDISQSFDFPTVYTSQGRFGRRLVDLRKTEQTLAEKTISGEVRSVYMNWLIAGKKMEMRMQEDSIYENFLRAVKLKFETGEINLLTKSVAETQALNIQKSLSETEIEYLGYEQQLKGMLGINRRIVPQGEVPDMDIGFLQIDTSDITSPRLEYLATKTTLMDAAVKMEQNKYLPAFSLGYFNQSIDDVDGFQGWKVGISVPVWFWSQSSKVQQAKIELDQADFEMNFEQNKLNLAIKKHRQEIERLGQLLSEYEDKTLSQIEQIINDSYTSLEEGEITYFEYVLSISHAYEMKLSYFDLLNKYNQAIIRMEQMIIKNTEN